MGRLKRTIESEWEQGVGKSKFDPIEWDGPSEMSKDLNNSQANVMDFGS